MMNIPIRFNRLAAAFDEGAKRSCESSGSDHSADLYDLVNSFHEREFRDQKKSIKEGDWDMNVSDEELLERKCNMDVEFKDSLKNLFDYENDVVKLSIQAEVETALREVGVNKTSSPEFKRRLMARLRDRGFDAGLCKSKWEKKGRTPLGEYEYIDINVNGTRYIIEVFLAGEFTIARPTSYYTSLLRLLPPIYVGQPNELKQIVRLMCNAIRTSMKSVDFYVPPWRRLEYLQAKWFGTYKRTTNEVLSQKVLKSNGDMARNRSHGIMPVQGISFYCKEDFGARSSIRVGYLSLELNQKRETFM